MARYEGGILLEGSSPMVIPGCKEANLVIGTYIKDQQGRVVVSNSSCEEPASFTLELREPWKLNQVFASIDAQSAEGSGLSWNLNPGGSVILELE